MYVPPRHAIRAVGRYNRELRAWYARKALPVGLSHARAPRRNSLHGWQGSSVGLSMSCVRRFGRVHAKKRLPPRPQKPLIEPHGVLPGSTACRPRQEIRVFTSPLPASVRAFFAASCRCVQKSSVMLPRPASSTRCPRRSRSRRMMSLCIWLTRVPLIPMASPISRIVSCS